MKEISLEAVSERKVSHGYDLLEFWDVGVGFPIHRDSIVWHRNNDK
jgi:hypothetical protein